MYSRCTCSLWLLLSSCVGCVVVLPTLIYMCVVLSWLLLLLLYSVWYRGAVRCCLLVYTLIYTSLIRGASPLLLVVSCAWYRLISSCRLLYRLVSSCCLQSVVLPRYSCRSSIVVGRDCCCSLSLVLSSCGTSCSRSPCLLAALVGCLVVPVACRLSYRAWSGHRLGPVGTLRRPDWRPSGGGAIFQKGGRG